MVTFGSLDFGTVFEAAAGKQQGVLTAIALLLLVGACGKSAQLPLYVWLPDAMEGPTPVSALIHAATMVAAGVYMLCRVFPLLVLSPTGMFNSSACTDNSVSISNPREITGHDFTKRRDITR